VAEPKGILPAEITTLDPATHPGWDELLAKHPDAGVFHRTAWARVLEQTYGHQAAYFCRLEAGELSAVLPVMEADSPLTGRRGVGLPFTDFVQPLGGANGGEETLYDYAMRHGRQRKWRYLECRGNNLQWRGATPSLAFYRHRVDLSGGADAVFQRCASAVRRGIRKAETSGLSVSFGTDLEAIRAYYTLHCETRRRHGVPPQPRGFFENLARFVFGAGEGFAAIATLEGRPIAGSVFLFHGLESIYKFGASDYRFQHLRPNNLVMWAAIKRLIDQGAKLLDLGRTSLAGEGLRRFKLGFGATEETVEYRRYDFRAETFVRSEDRAEGWHTRVFRLMPASLFRFSGRMLYPHLS
jgi:CelD/BcsL family acetyltransferase involved in cellulose biosynthesis